MIERAGKKKSNVAKRQFWQQHSKFIEFWSRKEWLLWMFKRAGKKSKNITKYQFWQHHNKPIEL